MKKVLCLFLCLIIVSVFAACDLSSNSSDTGIKELSFSMSKDSIEIEAGEESKGNIKVDSYKDFTEKDIELISTDESVATFEFDNITLKKYVYYKITAITPGTTTVYAQTKDSKIKSKQVTVTVTGDMDTIIEKDFDKKIRDCGIPSTIEAYDTPKGVYRIYVVLNVNDGTLDNAKTKVVKAHNAIKDNKYPIEQYLYEVRYQNKNVAIFTIEPSQEEFWVTYNGETSTFTP